MKQRMPYLSILFVLLFFLHTSIGQAAENPENGEIDQEPIMQTELVQAQIDRLGVDELKQYWDDIVTEYGGFLPESQKGSFMDFVSGDKKFSFDQWIKGITKFIFHELLVNGKLLGSLINRFQHVPAVFAERVRTKLR
jgi:stage III sporulation protein AE